MGYFSRSVLGYFSKSADSPGISQKRRIVNDETLHDSPNTGLNYGPQVLNEEEASGHYQRTFGIDAGSLSPGSNTLGEKPSAERVALSEYSTT